MGNASSLGGLPPVADLPGAVQPGPSGVDESRDRRLCMRALPAVAGSAAALGEGSNPPFGCSVAGTRTPGRRASSSTGGCEGAAGEGASASSAKGGSALAPQSGSLCCPLCCNANAAGTAASPAAPSTCSSSLSSSSSSAQFGGGPLAAPQTQEKGGAAASNSASGPHCHQQQPHQQQPHPTSQQHTCRAGSSPTVAGASAAQTAGNPQGAVNSPPRFGVFLETPSGSIPLVRIGHYDVMSPSTDPLAAGAAAAGEAAGSALKEGLPEMAGAAPASGVSSSPAPPSLPSSTVQTARALEASVSGAANNGGASSSCSSSSSSCASASAFASAPNVAEELPAPVAAPFACNAAIDAKTRGVDVCSRESPLRPEGALGGTSSAASSAPAVGGSEAAVVAASGCSAFSSAGTAPESGASAGGSLNSHPQSALPLGGQQGGPGLSSSCSSAAPPLLAASSSGGGGIHSCASRANSATPGGGGPSGGGSDPSVVEFYVRNFWKVSKTQNDLESPQQGLCRGFAFRLLLHPRGTTGTDSESTHLSVFLEAVRQDWYPDDWVFPNVRFELTVVNFRDPKLSVTSWAHWSFSAEATSRGWQKMIAHSKLSKQTGFMAEDGCILVRGRAEPPFPTLWSKGPLYRPHRTWEYIPERAAKALEEVSNSCTAAAAALAGGSSSAGGGGSNSASSSSCTNALQASRQKIPTASLLSYADPIVPALEPTLGADYVALFVHIYLWQTEVPQGPSPEALARDPSLAAQIPPFTDGSLIGALQHTFAYMQLWPLAVACKRLQQLTPGSAGATGGFFPASTSGGAAGVSSIRELCPSEVWKWYGSELFPKNPPPRNVPPSAAFSGGASSRHATCVVCKRCSCCCSCRTPLFAADGGGPPGFGGGPASASALTSSDPLGSAEVDRRGSPPQTETTSSCASSLAAAAAAVAAAENIHEAFERENWCERDACLSCDLAERFPECMAQMPPPPNIKAVLKALHFHDLQSLDIPDPLVKVHNELFSMLFREVTVARLASRESVEAKTSSQSGIPRLLPAAAFVDDEAGGAERCAAWDGDGGHPFPSWENIWLTCQELFGTSRRDALLLAPEGLPDVSAEFTRCKHVHSLQKALESCGKVLKQYPGVLFVYFQSAKQSRKGELFDVPLRLDAQRLLQREAPNPRGAGAERVAGAGLNAAGSQERERQRRKLRRKLQHSRKGSKAGEVEESDNSENGLMLLTDDSSDDQLELQLESQLQSHLQSIGCASASKVNSNPTANNKNPTPNNNPTHNRPNNTPNNPSPPQQQQASLQQPQANGVHPGNNNPTPSNNNALPHATPAQQIPSGGAANSGAVGEAQRVGGQEKWYSLFALFVREGDVRGDGGGSGTSHYLLLRPEEDGPWFRLGQGRVERLSSKVDFTEWKCHRDFFCGGAVYIAEDYIDEIQAGEVDLTGDLRQLNPWLYYRVLYDLGITEQEVGRPSVRAAAASREGAAAAVGSAANASANDLLPKTQLTEGTPAVGEGDAALAVSASGGDKCCSCCCQCWNGAGAEGGAALRSRAEAHPPAEVRSEEAGSSSPARGDAAALERQSPGQVEPAQASAGEKPAEEATCHPSSKPTTAPSQASPPAQSEFLLQQEPPPQGAAPEGAGRSKNDNNDSNNNNNDNNQNNNNNNNNQDSNNNNNQDNERRVKPARLSLPPPAAPSGADVSSGGARGQSCCEGGGGPPSPSGVSSAESREQLVQAAEARALVLQPVLAWLFSVTERRVIVSTHLASAEAASPPRGRSAAGAASSSSLSDNPGVDRDTSAAGGVHFERKMIEKVLNRTHDEEIVVGEELRHAMAEVVFDDFLSRACPPPPSPAAAAAAAVAAGSEIDGWSSSLAGGHWSAGSPQCYHLLNPQGRLLVKDFAILIQHPLRRLVEVILALAADVALFQKWLHLRAAELQQAREMREAQAARGGGEEESAASLKLGEWPDAQTNCCPVASRVWTRVLTKLYDVWEAAVTCTADVVELLTGPTAAVAACLISRGPPCNLAAAVDAAMDLLEKRRGGGRLSPPPSLSGRGSSAGGASAVSSSFSGAGSAAAASGASPSPSASTASVGGAANAGGVASQLFGGKRFTVDCISNATWKRLSPAEQVVFFWRFDTPAYDVGVNATVEMTSVMRFCFGELPPLRAVRCVLRRHRQLTAHLERPQEVLRIFASKVHPHFPVVEALWRRLGCVFNERAFVQLHPDRREMKPRPSSPQQELLMKQLHRQFSKELRQQAEEAALASRGEEATDDETLPCLPEPFDDCGPLPPAAEEILQRLLSQHESRRRGKASLLPGAVLEVLTSILVAVLDVSRRDASEVPRDCVVRAQCARVFAAMRKDAQTFFSPYEADEAAAASVNVFAAPPDEAAAAAAAERQAFCGGRLPRGECNCSLCLADAAAAVVMRGHAATANPSAASGVTSSSAAEAAASPVASSAGIPAEAPFTPTAASQPPRSPASTPGQQNSHLHPQNSKKKKGARGSAAGGPGGGVGRSGVGEEIEGGPLVVPWLDGALSKVRFSQVAAAAVDPTLFRQSQSMVDIPPSDFGYACGAGGPGGGVDGRCFEGGVGGPGGGVVMSSPPGAAAAGLVATTAGSASDAVAEAERSAAAAARATILFEGPVKFVSAAAAAPGLDGRLNPEQQLLRLAAVSPHQAQVELQQQRRTWDRCSNYLEVGFLVPEDLRGIQDFCIEERLPLRGRLLVRRVDGLGVYTGAGVSVRRLYAGVHLLLHSQLGTPGVGSIGPPPGGYPEESWADVRQKYLWSGLNLDPLDEFSRKAGRDCFPFFLFAVKPDVDAQHRGRRRFVYMRPCEALDSFIDPKRLMVDCRGPDITVLVMAAPARLAQGPAAAVSLGGGSQQPSAPLFFPLETDQDFPLLLFKWYSQDAVNLECMGALVCDAKQQLQHYVLNWLVPEARRRGFLQDADNPVTAEELVVLEEGNLRSTQHIRRWSCAIRKIRRLSGDVIIVYRNQTIESPRTVRCRDSADLLRRLEGAVSQQSGEEDGALPPAFHALGPIGPVFDSGSLDPAEAAAALGEGGRGGGSAREAGGAFEEEDGVGGKRRKKKSKKTVLPKAAIPSNKKSTIARLAEDMRREDRDRPPSPPLSPKRRQPPTPPSTKPLEKEASSVVQNQTSSPSQQRQGKKAAAARREAETAQMQTPNEAASRRRPPPLPPSLPPVEAAEFLAEKKKPELGKASTGGPSAPSGKRAAAATAALPSPKEAASSSALHPKAAAGQGSSSRSLQTPAESAVSTGKKAALSLEEASFATGGAGAHRATPQEVFGEEEKRVSRVGIPATDLEGAAAGAGRAGAKAVVVEGGEALSPRDADFPQQQGELPAAAVCASEEVKAVFSQETLASLQRICASRQTEPEVLAALSLELLQDVLYHVAAAADRALTPKQLATSQQNSENFCPLASPLLVEGVDALDGICAKCLSSQQRPAVARCLQQLLIKELHLLVELSPSSRAAAATNSPSASRHLRGEAEDGGVATTAGAAGTSLRSGSAGLVSRWGSPFYSGLLSPSGAGRAAGGSCASPGGASSSSGEGNNFADLRLAAFLRLLPPKRRAACELFSWLSVAGGGRVITRKVLSAQCLAFLEKAGGGSGVLRVAAVVLMLLVLGPKHLSRLGDSQQGRRFVDAALRKLAEFFLAKAPPALNSSASYQCVPAILAGDVTIESCCKTSLEGLQPLVAWAAGALLKWIQLAKPAQLSLPRSAEAFSVVQALQLPAALSLAARASPAVVSSVGLLSQTVGGEAFAESPPAFAAVAAGAASTQRSSQRRVVHEAEGAEAEAPGASPSSAGSVCPASWSAVAEGKTGRTGAGAGAVSASAASPQEGGGSGRAKQRLSLELPLVGGSGELGDESEGSRRGSPANSPSHGGELVEAIDEREDDSDGDEEAGEEGAAGPFLALPPMHRVFGERASSSAVGKTSGGGRRTFTKAAPYVVGEGGSWIVLYKPAYWHCSGLGKSSQSLSSKAANSQEVEEALAHVKVDDLVNSGRIESFHLYILKKYPRLETVRRWEEMECGLCHRTDLETSGCLLIAKTKRSRELIFDQFRRRSVHKQYLLLCHGRLEKLYARIDQPIATRDFDSNRSKSHFSAVVGRDEGGEEALTEYQVLKVFRLRTPLHPSVASALAAASKLLSQSASSPASGSAGGASASAGKTGGAEKTNSKNKAASASSAYTQEFSFCRVKIHTGRTHQIRVHFRHIGHPLVGDSKYCDAARVSVDRSWCGRMFLHSALLAFGNPDTPDLKPVRVTCPLAAELAAALEHELVCVEDYSAITKDMIDADGQVAAPYRHLVVKNPPDSQQVAKTGKSLSAASAGGASPSAGAAGGGSGAVVSASNSPSLGSFAAAVTAGASSPQHLRHASSEAASGRRGNSQRSAAASTGTPASSASPLGGKATSFARSVGTRRSSASPSADCAQPRGPAFPVVSPLSAPSSSPGTSATTAGQRRQAPVSAAADCRRGETSSFSDAATLRHAGSGGSPQSVGDLGLGASASFAPSPSSSSGAAAFLSSSSAGGDREERLAIPSSAASEGEAETVSAPPQRSSPRESVMNDDNSSHNNAFASSARVCVDAFEDGVATLPRGSSPPGASFGGLVPSTQDRSVGAAAEFGGRLLKAASSEDPSAEPVPWESAQGGVGFRDFAFDLADLIAPPHNTSTSGVRAALENWATSQDSPFKQRESLSFIYHLQRHRLQQQQQQAVALLLAAKHQLVQLLNLTGLRMFLNPGEGGGAPGLLTVAFQRMSGRLLHISDVGGAFRVVTEGAEAAAQGGTLVGASAPRGWSQLLEAFAAAFPSEIAVVVRPLAVYVLLLPEGEAAMARLQAGAAAPPQGSASPGAGGAASGSSNPVNFSAAAQIVSEFWGLLSQLHHIDFLRSLGRETPNLNLATAAPLPSTAALRRVREAANSAFEMTNAAPAPPPPLAQAAPSQPQQLFLAPLRPPLGSFDAAAAAELLRDPAAARLAGMLPTPPKLVAAQQPPLAAGGCAGAGPQQGTASMLPPPQGLLPPQHALRGGMGDYDGAEALPSSPPAQRPSWAASLWNDGGTSRRSQLQLPFMFLFEDEGADAAAPTNPEVREEDLCGILDLSFLAASTPVACGGASSVAQSAASADGREGGVFPSAPVGSLLPQQQPHPSAPPPAVDPQQSPPSERKAAVSQAPQQQPHQQQPQQVAMGPGGAAAGGSPRLHAPPPQQPLLGGQQQQQQPHQQQPPPLLHGGAAGAGGSSPAAVPPPPSAGARPPPPPALLATTHPSPQQTAFSHASRITLAQQPPPPHLQHAPPHPPLSETPAELLQQRARPQLRTSAEAQQVFLHGKWCVRLDVPPPPSSPPPNPHLLLLHQQQQAAAAASLEAQHQQRPTAASQRAAAAAAVNNSGGGGVSAPGLGNGAGAASASPFSGRAPPPPPPSSATPSSASSVPAGVLPEGSSSGVAGPSAAATGGASSASSPPPPPPGLPPPPLGFCIAAAGGGAGGAAPGAGQAGVGGVPVPPMRVHPSLRSQIAASGGDSPSQQQPPPPPPPNSASAPPHALLGEERRRAVASAGAPTGGSTNGEGLLPMRTNGAAVWGPSSAQTGSAAAASAQIQAQFGGGLVGGEQQPHGTNNPQQQQRR